MDKPNTIGADCYLLRELGYSIEDAVAEVAKGLAPETAKVGGQDFESVKQCVTNEYMRLLENM